MDSDEQARVRFGAAFMTVQAITTVRLVMALAWLVVVWRLEPLAAAMYYVIMLLTDVLDGALARRFGVATVGGDWYDTIADRIVNVVSMIYAVAIGAPALACALVLVREMVVAAMVGIGPEPPIGAVRFYGLVAGIPLRVVTAVVVIADAPSIASLIPTLYWATAVLSVATLPPKVSHIRLSFLAAFRRPHRAPLIR